jgi:hypothetical protein
MMPVSLVEGRYAILMMVSDKSISVSADGGGVPCEGYGADLIGGRSVITPSRSSDYANNRQDLCCDPGVEVGVNFIENLLLFFRKCLPRSQIRRTEHFIRVRVGAFCAEGLIGLEGERLRKMIVTGSDEFFESCVPVAFTFYVSELLCLSGGLLCLFSGTLLRPRSHPPLSAKIIVLLSPVRSSADFDVSML